MDVRVLVTGGEGFIGSTVVDELVAAGCEVVSLDLLHPAAHRLPPATSTRRRDGSEPTSETTKR